MQMHPYFTEIPIRSFEAIQLNGYLSEVLLAMIVDPLAAEDVALTIRKIYETRIKLVSNESRRSVVYAPIRLEDFKDLGLKSFEAMKITVAQWVMTAERANAALRVLTMWDRRFGVWCAAAVAREALRYVPAGVQRPLRAIEAAEAWVNGNATIDTVRDAAADAADYAAYAATAAAADAAAAANAAAAAALRAASRAAYDAYASRAASDAASAYAYANASAAWEANRDAELIRLREVVANACLTFPG